MALENSSARMFSLSVGKTFNNMACWDCPVTDCEGGKFVSELEVAADDVKVIIQGSAERAAEAVMAGDAAIDEFAAELVADLKDSSVQQAKAAAAGNVFLQKVIETQKFNPATKLDIDALYAPMLEELAAESPINPYVRDLSPEALDRLAQSVISYAVVGICGAIDVESHA